MNKERLKILSKSEITELYSVPQFNANERRAHFSLSKKEYKAMESRGSLASKVHFILQLGYFKATSQFFDCKFDETKHDVDFILQEHWNNARLYTNTIAKQTRQTNQMLISKILGYQSDKSIVRKKIEKILVAKAKLSSNPVYLFHEVLCYCDQYKLMVLGYSTLQDIIGAAIMNEEKRLGDLLEKHLSHDDWKSVNSMIEKSGNEYVLTALRKEPKNFKLKHIKEEITKLTDHEPLYQIAKSVLPKMQLTAKNIEYYASLAEHYPVSNLKKLSLTKQAIYILCFSYHRHQKINDNLALSFTYYYNKFKDEAAAKTRDRIFNERMEINDDSKNAALVLRFFDDETISDRESFGNVRKRAYKHVKRGKFHAVSDYLLGALFDYQKIKWEEITKFKKRITANIRPIFKSLEFTGSDTQKGLISAIEFLKKYFSASLKERKTLITKTPVGCIPKKWRVHLMVAGENKEASDNTEIVDISKYEFMIYHLISEKTEAGLLYLENSISFKSLSSHLINDAEWANKSALLKKLGNKKLLMSADQLLDDLENKLEHLIKHINTRIKNGDNKGITIKKNGDEITFTLPYPDSDKENHPIFGQTRQINIASVLQFAQNDCNFMSVFTHIKPYDAKDTLDPTAIMACIIANATNLGIYKMAESSDLSYQRMYTQSKNFLRLETLKEANNEVTNAIANLPIFKYWNIHDDYIHGSVDGQKYETRLHSFIARYSSKYFGVNKGCVAYTLCANHIPVNAKIISANHHESHYLFDILFNDTSEVDIQCLSGDGHSINQVNFTLLDFIGKQFAPHFKSINRKANGLCGFKSLSHYKNMLIKPKAKFNRKNFKDEWDNIKRIIASLLLGETAQHMIVSKLSSHKRKNKTKEALWEYDRILMSTYMLKFIDDQMIRQNVRRALNRGEAYHKLRRAISNVHGSKFRGRNDKEISLWNECARLMANCMIYYNAKLLNALLSKLQKEGNEELIEKLKYISPVAWININLYGYYTFEVDEVNTINVAKFAEAINMRKTV